MSTQDSIELHKFDNYLLFFCICILQLKVASWKFYVNHRSFEKECILTDVVTFITSVNGRCKWTLLCIFNVTAIVIKPRGYSFQINLV